MRGRLGTLAGTPVLLATGGRPPAPGMSAWERRDDGFWHRVRGPVTVRLGWNGWVRAGRSGQSTGTTPAGRSAMRYAFGSRADPGTALRYRRLDRSDM